MDLYFIIRAGVGVETNNGALMELYKAGGSGRGGGFTVTCFTWCMSEFGLLNCRRSINSCW